MPSWHHSPWSRRFGEWRRTRTSASVQSHSSSVRLMNRSTFPATPDATANAGCPLTAPAISLKSEISPTEKREALPGGGSCVSALELAISSSSSSSAAPSSIDASGRCSRSQFSCDVATSLGSISLGWGPAVFLSAGAHQGVKDVTCSRCGTWAVESGSIATIELQGCSRTHSHLRCCWSAAARCHGRLAPGCMLIA